MLADRRLRSDSLYVQVRVLGGPPVPGEAAPGIAGLGIRGSAPEPLTVGGGGKLPKPVGKVGPLQWETQGLMEET